MNKITYLDHSGFMVETPQALLVFDYYRDPANKVVKTLKHNPELPVVFFVSHKHHDHYNHEILNLGQNHKRLYFISNDIVDRDLHHDQPVNWVSPGDSFEDQLGGIVVKAYPTTGHGCSFVVTTAEGTKIFHAGELGEPLAHNDGASRDAAKFDNAFKVAVNRIREDENRFDMAMMSVDTSDSPDFAAKATYLLEAVETANFVPYHTDDAADKACNFAMYPLTKNIDTKMICLTRPGESAEF